MLKIRLQRVGRKHETSFRVVLIDSRRAPQSGAFLEVLGSYNPARNDAIQLKGERIAYWITQGSQVSGTVHNILVDQKIISGPKRDVSPAQKQKTEKGPAGTTQTAPGTETIKTDKDIAAEETRDTTETASDSSPEQQTIKPSERPAIPKKEETAPEKEETAPENDKDNRKAGEDGQENKGK